MWNKGEWAFLGLVALSFIHIVYIFLSLAFNLDCIYYDTTASSSVCCNMLKIGRNIK